MAGPIPTPVLGRLNAPGTTFPMSPLSPLGHVNRKFVARYGPALHPYPQGGAVLLNPAASP
jgi:hypothetical protein